MRLFTLTVNVYCASQVCTESQRFEKLMEYFKNEDNNIDFMVRTNKLLMTIDCTVRLQRNTSQIPHLTGNGLPSFLSPRGTDLIVFPVKVVLESNLILW